MTQNNSTGAGLKIAIRSEMGQLVGSVERLVERFAELTSPICESSSRVPEATRQLEKVTQQTEQATHQVLDSIEKILEREEKLLEGLKSLLDEVGDNAAVIGTIKTFRGWVQENLDSAFDIMNTLQFQDITAQQMQHASQVLEEIQSRLQRLMGTIDGAEIAEEPSRAAPSYDPNATFDRNGEEQAEADALMRQMGSPDTGTQGS